MIDDRRDRRRVCFGDREVGFDHTRALHEEFGGRVACQRTDGIDALSPQMERLAARREHGEARRLREQRADPGRGRRQVLERIEHEQHVAIAEMLGHVVSGRSAGRFTQPERARNRARHRGRLGDPRQLGDRNAVLELTGPLDRDLRGETRFADAGRAGERHEAYVAPREQRADAFGVGVAADERNGLKCRDRRECGGRTRRRFAGRVL